LPAAATSKIPFGILEILVETANSTPLDRLTSLLLFEKYGSQEISIGGLGGAFKE
jgi:hypothetical protein